MSTKRYGAIMPMPSIIEVVSLIDARCAKHSIVCANDLLNYSFRLWPGSVYTPNQFNIKHSARTLYSFPFGFKQFVWCYQQCVNSGLLLVTGEKLYPQTSKIVRTEVCQVCGALYTARKPSCATTWATTKMRWNEEEEEGIMSRTTAPIVTNWLADFPWSTPDPWLTCDHFVGKASAMGQPTRPTLFHRWNYWFAVLSLWSYKIFS